MSVRTQRDDIPEVTAAGWYKLLNRDDSQLNDLFRLRRPEGAEARGLDGVTQQNEHLHQAAPLQNPRRE